MLDNESIPSLALPSGFYKRETITLARELLGMMLVKKTGETWSGGLITETEAYLRAGRSRKSRISEEDST